MKKIFILFAVAFIGFCFLRRKQAGYDSDRDQSAGFRACGRDD